MEKNQEKAKKLYNLTKEQKLILDRINATEKKYMNKWRS